MVNLLTTAVVVLACLTAWVFGADDVVEIESYYGKIRGRMRKSADGIAVKQFLGVPYAKPPIRFKKPETPDKFKKPYEAINMPPACPQFAQDPFPSYDSEPGQSEDCLYINVWAPANSTRQNRRPIKLYIHGGGWFETGSNRMGYYDGFAEALDTKDKNGNSMQDGVVVVTVNYRLGALGFLTSGTDDAPGNAGLFDLGQAYNYLLNTAIYFGGDYRDMTIVGQDSGAIAASLATTAITQFFLATTKYEINGATFLTFKALPGVGENGDPYENNLRLTDVLAQKLGCKTSVKDKPKETIDCLTAINATDLVKTMSAISKKGPPNVFLPQTQGPDKFFAYADPYLALHEYAYSWHDVLLTFTSDEGSDLLTRSFPKVFGEFGEKDQPLSAACARKIARKFLTKFPENVTDALLGNLDKKATKDNRKKVIQAFGDAYYGCPRVFFAEDMKRVKQQKPSPYVAYLLEKQVYPPYNPYSYWMGSVSFLNAQIEFVHPDGKLTVNGKTYTYTDEQSKQARVNSQLFKDFANGRKLQFPEYTIENPAYGVFGSDSSFSSNSQYHKQNCDILRPYFEYKKTA